MPMRPYKKKRGSCPRLASRSYIQQVSDYLQPFYRDIVELWEFQPPYPLTIKVAATAIVVLLLLMPAFFISLLPLWTLACFQVILGPLCPYDILNSSWVTWYLQMEVTEWDKYVLQMAMKEMFRKTSVKVSIMVASYDYIQTLRALGIEQQLPPEID